MHIEQALGSLQSRTPAAACTTIWTSALRATFLEHDRKSLELVAQVFNLAGHENLLNSATTTRARATAFGTITNAGNLQQGKLAAHFVF